MRLLQRAEHASSALVAAGVVPYCSIAWSVEPKASFVICARSRKSVIEVDRWLNACSPRVEGTSITTPPASAEQRR